MRGFVANTHYDWFNFLARKSSWDEVNFWNPSDYYSFRGEPGSPFFFRLKAPRNAIGGFGIFARFDKLPEWLAWECFEAGNGAATLGELQARLQNLRDSNKITGRTGVRQIGCIILTGAVFFPENLWVRQPSDWGWQNMRYKAYDLTSGEGLRIWRECQERTGAIELGGAATIAERHGVERFGKPVLVCPRLGQGTFRLAVTAAYSRACAVTGEHSLPALEAAHIRPYGEGGEHDVNNGILFRSDLHRLFDRGYLTVTPDLRLEVSNRLRLDYDNGRSYYPLHGVKVSAPQSSQEAPAVEWLKWHNENKFLAT
jgi:putative restriction endonuclease